MHIGNRARSRRGKGFSLLEVVVAIAIGGMVIIGAQHLVDTLANQADHFTEQTAVDTERANGERQLRELVGQLQVGSPGTAPFFGDSASARFSTWCGTAAGWLEQCTVTVSIAAMDEAPAVIADLPNMRRLVLARGFSHGAFRYLETAAGGGEWVTRWGPGSRAPIALGVVLDTDTVIVRVGDRG